MKKKRVEEKRAPLVGNTEVLVKLLSDWEVKTMRQLLSIKTSFKVITWTGSLFKTAEAYASYEGDTAEIYRIKVAGRTYECDAGHPWPVVRSGSVVPVPACELKTGYEMVSHPAFIKSGDINLAKLANVTTHSKAHITSVKRKTASEWVGCITVSGHSNYMLASGVLTGTCRE